MVLVKAIAGIQQARIKIIKSEFTALCFNYLLISAVIIF